MEGDSPTPHPRSGHRVVVTDGNLYALGGYNPDVVDSDVEDVEELTRRIFIQVWLGFETLSSCCEFVMS